MYRELVVPCDSQRALPRTDPRGLQMIQWRKQMDGVMYITRSACTSIRFKPMAIVWKSITRIRMGTSNAQARARTHACLLSSYLCVHAPMVAIGLSSLPSRTNRTTPLRPCPCMCRNTSVTVIRPMRFAHVGPHSALTCTNSLFMCLSQTWAHRFCCKGGV